MHYPFTRVLLGSTMLLAAAGVLAADSQPHPADAAVEAASLKEDETSEVLLDESFENVFPRLPWRVSHPPDAADVDWGRTRVRASDGDWSIYCAGAGTQAPGDGGPAPAGTASWAIVGPYDLSETASGTLSFRLWLATELYHDVFMWLVSTDGQSFSGSARTTDTSGWQTVTADLANWGAAGSVVGEDEVWIAFVYQSDHNNLHEGAYIDEVVLTVDLGTAGSEGRTYTTNADFAEGVLVGLEASSDRLELADTWDALPYIWVPNSINGTVSKLDAADGAELARFRTGPDSSSDPDIAAVDLEGSCWIGNRGTGTVVKIGLLENGGCVDRDGSGVIETSTDSNGDGDITGSELLAWGEDECVIVEVALLEGSEGPHLPGDGHDDYPDGGYQAVPVAIDANGDAWAGVYDTNMLYRLDGTAGDVLETVDLVDDATFPTSAVIDADGTLWMSSWPDQWVLGYEPGTQDTTRIDLPHGSGRVTVDRDNRLLVTGFEDSLFSKVDTETPTVEWTQVSGFTAEGIATSENGRIWVAASSSSTLSRYSSAGVLNRFVEVPGRPVGVAVDQDGKIWTVGSESDTVYRFDQDSLVSDLQKPLLGTASHPATGDLTGIIVRNLTSQFGTWTVIYDSEVAGTPWGLLSWNAQNPGGTLVAVRARSSEDGKTWSAWEPAADDVELAQTPAGRYLEVQVSLQKLGGDDNPRMQELTITPASTAQVPVASFTADPGAPLVGEAVSFQDTSTGSPTSWSWNFGDGETSTEQNPTHSFASAGSFDVALTAANDEGSDTDTQTIVVAEPASCSVTCSATAPQTGELSAPVAFAADATATDCIGAIAYSWSFGDGGTSATQNPSHTYGDPGTLRWGLTATADSESCTAAGDITIVGSGPDECTVTRWVPVISRTDGLDGSVWRSDIGLLGTSDETVAAELRLRTPDVAASRVITVTSGAMVALVDVIGWLDAGFDGSGSLEICADGELGIDTRTYNLLPDDHPSFPDGTQGQHLGGSSTEEGLAADETGSLGLLRESDDFRTNIGLVNTGSDPSTVEMVLFDAAGIELTRFEIELAPGEWSQLTRPFWKQAGRKDLDAASAQATVVTGAGIIVYGSVIDKRTNDATTIPMRR